MRAVGRSFNAGTDLCLAAKSDGTVLAAPCDGQNRQNWHLRLGGPDRQAGNLINDQTGQCLDSNPQGQVFTRPVCRIRSSRKTWIGLESCTTGVVWWEDEATLRFLTTYADGSVDTQPQRPTHTLQQWYLGGWSFC